MNELYENFKKFFAFNRKTGVLKDRKIIAETLQDPKFRLPVLD